MSPPSCRSSLVLFLRAALLLPILPTSAAPLHDTASDSVDGRLLSDGLPLRIMPLGASITRGVASSDGNGYRQDLRRQLVLGGNLVNMVGSDRNGTMIDSDNEGWPGFIIDQIHDKARAAVPKMKPNVILVNAGTNDCIQNVDVANAAKRMESMLDDLYTMSPGTTVVLSSLLVNRQRATEDRVTGVVNPQYEALASRMRAAGRRIVFVDMHGPDGPQLDDMADDTHPDDAGYKKMADIWFRGLTNASDSGFIQRAAPVLSLGDDGNMDTSKNGRIVQSPQKTDKSAASSFAPPSAWLGASFAALVFWICIWIL